MKLVAALPLLPLGLPVSPAPNIFFRGASAVGGIQFLYAHDADALLFRARVAASLFALIQVRRARRREADYRFTGYS